MLQICALFLSLGSPNLYLQNISAHAFTYVLNKRHSKRALTFRINKYFGYENLLTVVVTAPSFSISNWLQKLNESKYVLSCLLVIS